MSSRFPMTSFPKGWFTVAWSSQLEPGDVKPLRYFDRDLVLYRDESGEPHVLDAHCPHMGAHLGHGGVVRGERLECPFHAWQFGGDGRCQHIPYASKIPGRARVRVWTVTEKNGVVMVWHDPDGEGPAWDMPDVPFVHDEAWFGEQAYAEWTIKSHVQELVENAVDQAHFLAVHSLEAAEVFDLRPEGHHLNMHGRFVMQPGSDAAKLEWNWLGISFGYVHTVNPGGIENCQLLMYTPIDEEHVHVRFTTVVKRVKDDALSRRILHATNDETIRLFNQDIEIWEAKIYRSRPELAQGDGDLMKYRRWCKQFYGGTAAG